MPEQIIDAINIINEFAKRALLNHQEHVQHVKCVEEISKWIQSTRAIDNAETTASE